MGELIKALGLSRGGIEFLHPRYLTARMKLENTFAGKHFSRDNMTPRTAGMIYFEGY